VTLLDEALFVGGALTRRHLHARAPPARPALPTDGDKVEAVFRRARGGEAGAGGARSSRTGTSLSPPGRAGLTNPRHLQMRLRARIRASARGCAARRSSRPSPRRGPSLSSRAPPRLHAPPEVGWSKKPAAGIAAAVHNQLAALHAADFWDPETAAASEAAVLRGSPRDGGGPARLRGQATSGARGGMSGGRAAAAAVGATVRATAGGLRQPSRAPDPEHSARRRQRRRGGFSFEPGAATRGLVSPDPSRPPGRRGSALAREAALTATAAAAASNNQLSSMLPEAFAQQLLLQQQALQQQALQQAHLQQQHALLLQQAQAAAAAAGAGRSERRHGQQHYSSYMQGAPFSAPGVGQGPGVLPFGLPTLGAGVPGGAGHV